MGFGASDSALMLTLCALQMLVLLLLLLLTFGLKGAHYSRSFAVYYFEFSFYDVDTALTLQV